MITARTSRIAAAQASLRPRRVSLVRCARPAGVRDGAEPTRTGLRPGGGCELARTPRMTGRLVRLARSGTAPPGLRLAWPRTIRASRAGQVR